MNTKESTVRRSGSGRGPDARWTGRGATAFGVAAALLATMLVPAQPSAAVSRARAAQDVATWARAGAATPGVDRPDPAAQDAPSAADSESAAPVVWGTGPVVPDEGGQVSGDDVSVAFSGHGLEQAVEVTVSALDEMEASSAVDGATRVLLAPGFDISALDGDGRPVTAFPSGSTRAADRDGAVTAAARTATMPVIGTDDGSVLIGGLPIGQAPHPEGAHVDLDDTARSVAGDGDEDAPAPGVRIEVRVDDAALVGVRAGSVRLLTRETDADPWTVVPSYLDVATSTVIGELDHLSQFVVIGGKDTGDPRPRVVLDPDDDRGYATGPGPYVTEVGYNVRLANEVAARLTQVCHADVVVTRTTPVAEVSQAVRAGMAAAHDPDLTLTIGFNSTSGGKPWGDIGNGGSEVYARDGALDEQARTTMLSVLPVYTGRPANAEARATLPYDDFQGLPGALLHLETLYLTTTSTDP